MWEELANLSSSSTNQEWDMHVACGWGSMLTSGVFTIFVVDTVRDLDIVAYVHKTALACVML
jgi:hypothetical protein